MPSKRKLAKMLPLGKSKSRTPETMKAQIRPHFDTGFYISCRPPELLEYADPLDHYIEKGWRKGFDPSPAFSVKDYLAENPDVARDGVEPFYHWLRWGAAEGRPTRESIYRRTMAEVVDQSEPDLLRYEPRQIFSRAQDMMFPTRLMTTRKLMVFVVPEHSTMSGGIYSMYSLAYHMRRMKLEHGFDVLVVTRPNPGKLTYVRNHNFLNSETVYRFEQIRMCLNVDELVLHIPEYATPDFVSQLSRPALDYIMSRRHVRVNILNQNIRLMHEKDRFAPLRKIADQIGQSVAHHAYATQARADRYDLPTLLVPAYTDLSPYPELDFESKEKVILCSPDDARYKEPCLAELRRAMPDYKLIEINNLTFDEFMELTTRSKFSVSFGEGFDGYVSQMIHQGGIGFALYTPEFFPSDRFLKYDNFFRSEAEMIQDIAKVMRKLERDPAACRKLNADLRAEWEELYKYDEYIEQIRKLARGDYEIFPAGERSKEGAQVAAS